MEQQQDDIRGAIEALLNIAAQAAEMQVTEEGREAVYAILNLVAEHFDIAVDEVVEEELDDGSIHITFKTAEPAGPPQRSRAKLTVIQGSLLDNSEPDEDDQLH